MKSLLFRRFSVLILVILGVCLFPSLAWANSQNNPKTLVDSKVSKGFVFAPEVKISQVDGRFASFAGARFGLVLDHRFMIGLAGYGLTNVGSQPALGYGGVVLEYVPVPDRLVQFSVGGLVGAGGAFFESFFVAEPEARVRLNVTRWFRLGAGGGYRFIGGAGSYGDRILRGPAATISFEFGRF